MNFAELQPAPPVGFNLTFMCPEGEVCLQKHNLQYKVQSTNTNLWENLSTLSTRNIKFIYKENTMDGFFIIHLKVFDHDWFATPFVMLTCQVCARE